MDNREIRTTLKDYLKTLIRRHLPSDRALLPDMTGPVDALEIDGEVIPVEAVTRRVALEKLDWAAGEIVRVYRNISIYQVYIHESTGTSVYIRGYFE